MGPNLKEFLKTEASRPLSPEKPVLSERIRNLAGPMAREYGEMLESKNGFYGFSGALQVYSSGRAGIEDLEVSLEDWNDPALWIDAYKGDADGALFFAQDLEGNQFAFKDGQIQIFEPFYASFTPYAASLDEWSEKLVADPAGEVGWALAEVWIQEHGFMRRGERLVNPFSWSEEYVDKGTFGPVPMLEHLHHGAMIWDTIKNLPPGKKIFITVVDE